MAQPCPLEEAASSWIRKDMQSHNVSDLGKVLSSLQEATDPDTYSEYLDLHHVIEQLNQEMLNMFDNYLCFSGANDEAQFKRLSKMATTRAMSTLTSKHHVNHDSTDALLTQASKKLYAIYDQHNKVILQNEKKIHDQVFQKILQAYSEDIAGHLQQSDVDDIHNQIVQYVLKMMDRCLDFSAKMNGTLNTANKQLIKILDETFFSLRHPSDENQEIMVVPTDTSSPKSSPTLTNFQKCLFEYKKKMDKKLVSTKGHTLLYEFHEQYKTEISKNVKPEEKAVAQLAMDYYYCFMSEVVETFTITSQSTTGKTICINFANAGILTGIPMDTNPLSPWQWNQNEGNAIRMYRGKRSMEEILADYMIGYKKTKSRQQNIVKSVSYLKSLVTLVMSQSAENVCIIVPTWFGIYHREELRIMARIAGFKSAFFLRDSMLLASYLLSASNLPNQIVVGIRVSETGAIVEVFQKLVDGRIGLLAVARYDFDLRIENNNTLLCGMSRNSRKAIATQENPGGILWNVLNKAMTQLDEKQKKEKKLCFFLCQCDSWDNAYDTLLRSESFGLADVGQLEPNLATKEALKLIRNPAEIHQNLVDHPIWNKSEQQQQQQQDFSPSKRRESKSTLGTNERTQLLSTCKRMRDQMETGKVRVGVLMSKLLGESIKKAETVASDKTATKEALVEQQQKMNEYVKQHNFDIKV